MTRTISIIIADHKFCQHLSISLFYLIVQYKRKIIEVGCFDCFVLSRYLSLKIKKIDQVVFVLLLHCKKLIQEVINIVLLKQFNPHKFGLSLFIQKIFHFVL